MVVWCLLLLVDCRCSLLVVVRCLSFAVRRSLSVVYWLFGVDGCSSLFVLCRLPFVVCCLIVFAVCCLLFVVR